MKGSVITVHGKEIKYQYKRGEVLYSLEGVTESEIMEMKSRLCATTEVKATDVKGVNQEYYKQGGGIV